MRNIEGIELLEKLEGECVEVNQYAVTKSQIDINSFGYGADSIENLIVFDNNTENSISIPLNQILYIEEEFENRIVIHLFGDYKIVFDIQ